MDACVADEESPDPEPVVPLLPELDRPDPPLSPLPVMAKYSQEAATRTLYCGSYAWLQRSL